LAGIIPALGQQQDRAEAAAELDNLNSQLKSLQESEASLYAQVPRTLITHHHPKHGR